jgi:MFS family permease
VTLSLRIVMLCGGLLAALALVAINAVLPAIDAALAHSASDSMLVKQLLGAVGLAMVAGAPLGGFLVDRLGLRPLLVGGGLLYTAAGVAGLFLSSLPLLVGSRLAIGLVAGALQVISLTTINTRLTGEERARWMGMHISIAMLGTFVLHPIAGLLGNQGWRWPFLLYFLGLLLVPVGMALPSQPWQGRREMLDRVAAPSDEMARAQRGLLAVFPYHYLLLAIAIGSVVFIPTVYLPFILRNMGFGTPLAISLVLTADSVAGMIMAFLYGRARRRLSVYGAFTFSFSLTTLGMLISLVSSRPWALISGVMVYGIGVGWLIANMITALSVKVSAKHQGRAVGFIKAAHFASAPLAIVLIEPVVRAHGPRSALVVVAGLSAALLLLVGMRSLRKVNFAPE